MTVCSCWEWSMCPTCSSCAVSSLAYCSVSPLHCLQHTARQFSLIARPLTAASCIIDALRSISCVGRLCRSHWWLARRSISFRLPACRRTRWSRPVSSGAAAATTTAAEYHSCDVTTSVIVRSSRRWRLVRLAHGRRRASLQRGRDSRSGLQRSVRAHRSGTQSRRRTEPFQHTATAATRQRGAALSSTACISSTATIALLAAVDDSCRQRSAGQQASSPVLAASTGATAAAVERAPASGTAGRCRSAHSTVA